MGNIKRGTGHWARGADHPDRDGSEHGRRRGSDGRGPFDAGHRVEPGLLHVGIECQESAEFGILSGVRSQVASIGRRRRIVLLLEYSADPSAPDTLNGFTGCGPC